MPGWVVAIPTPHAESVEAAIVVEMGWAEEEGSFSYIYGPQFKVGAKILYPATSYSPVVADNGYVFVPVHAIMAWEP